MEKKKTTFVKASIQSDETQTDRRLKPYTNSVSFSVKVGSQPEKKVIGDYQVVQFACYLWQSRGKPQVRFTALCYDESLQKECLSLSIGQSIIVQAKFGLEIMTDGSQKLILFVNAIQ